MSHLGRFDDEPPPTCDLYEPGWGLICLRQPEHNGRHYGANTTGTHEGYWGEGVLHVTRTRRARMDV